MARFQPGVSGNPVGRKPGTGVAAKLRSRIEKDGLSIIEALIESAKAGDMQAASILIHRLIPPLKSQLPEVALSIAGNDPAVQGNAVLTELFAGNITPDTAIALITAIQNQVKLKESVELEKRVSALEATINGFD